MSHQYSYFDYVYDQNTTKSGFKKLQQDMRTAGNPNQLCRERFGINNNYPVFDMRSAASMLYYLKDTWTKQELWNFALSMYNEYCLQPQKHTSGIPQYISAKSYMEGNLDTANILCCARPKNYKLVTKVDNHFGNPFSEKAQANAIHVNSISQALEYFYLWLISDNKTYSKIYYDVYGNVLNFKAIEPERRHWMQSLYGFIWEKIVGLMCFCYDETQCHTWILRAHLAQLAESNSLTVTETMTQEQLDTLIAAAMGRDTYQNMTGRNWFTLFSKLSIPLLDPHHTDILYYYPIAYVYAQRFQAKEYKQELASKVLPQQVYYAYLELSKQQHVVQTQEHDVEALKHVIATQYRLTSRQGVKLIMSGDMLLTMYNQWHDMQFGQCVCLDHVRERGENIYGQLLMTYRKCLQNECLKTLQYMKKIA